MFTEPERASRGRSTAAIAVAGTVVLLVVALLAVSGRHKKSVVGKAAPVQGQSVAYAPQLVLSDLQLSESTSFSGGKETFVDGRIANHGPATVTGATVAVRFAGEGAEAPQVETVPVTLIRTRQPYIDVQPLSVAPLGPGADAAFRLTFDDVRSDWNQQPPAIQITGVTLR